MTPLTTRIFVTALGVLFLATGCSSLPELHPAPAAGTDLSGTWRLDREASDNPEEALQAAREIARIEGGATRGGGGGRRGMGGGGRSRRGGGAERGGQPAGDGQSDRQADHQSDGPGTRQPDSPGKGGPAGGPLALDEQLAFRQDGNVIDLQASRAGHWRYEPGVPITESTGRGDAEITTGWQQSTFIVVTQEKKRGVTRIDRFTRLPDNASLEVQTTLTAKMFREPVSVRRIYRSAPAGQNS